MGQNSLDCDTFGLKRKNMGVLNHELSLYRWRADNKINKFIARVQFKNASFHYQQE
jgi:hypothetical protein